MLTRRELIAGVAALAVGSSPYAAQDQEKKAPEKLETVTLTISGMT